MADHEFTMPVTEDDIRKLKIGDHVVLQDTLFGIRDATQIHMFDKGRETRLDLDGHAVIHTAPNVMKVPVSNSCPAGYQSICIGTTTSARMERFTRPLMERNGVRMIIGKGGLGENSAQAFQDLGGVYLAIIGGTAALETTWIKQIVDVDMDDLNPESLWHFRIKDFGPLLVAMDAHGGSLYDAVRTGAQNKRAAALAHFETIKTDVLILGAGGAGLFAALHVNEIAPDLSVTVAVKGLLGKCGCTRMVQGGYNVALAPGDSVERHFMDTVEGGKWLNDQDLAWTLVTVAQERVRELENELGCFFDRNEDGTVHQKAFAGQTFDRTVHKGDLTGIEIVGRLAEQVWARGLNRLEDHRAVEMIPSMDGQSISGVLMIDMRTGGFVFVKTRAVLLATGGGPTMYRYHTPSGDKTVDGMAMALRAGLALRDMEMVQFHPTGLLAGAETRMTGTVLEEGLRGYGAYLLDGDGERFMDKYDDRGERATRDIVSRAMFEEMRTGSIGPLGGLYLSMAHLDEGEVRRLFKGMVQRCADCGFDLAGDKVEVVPTAHYMMGGVEFGADGGTEWNGLFTAGEDTGGVHGANRLGGNGVANSTVFGGIAGDTIGRWTPQQGAFHDPDEAAIEAAIGLCRTPLSKPPGDLETIRTGLADIMWDDVGIVRDAVSLERALGNLTALEADLDGIGVDGGNLTYNLTWHDWINLKNMILVSRAITVAALARDDSRGAHYRTDFPETRNLESSTFTRVRYKDGAITTEAHPVHFTRVKPGETLLEE